MSSNPDIKTGASSTISPLNGDGQGPIINKSQESEEYQQDLQVVLGTAFGVIAVVAIIGLTALMWRLYKARQRALHYDPNDINDGFEGQMSVDLGTKSQPVVLVLYSPDCPIHERVVGALAAFLMEVCGVTVTLDLLEEGDLVERGVEDWLVDKLFEADFIMVVCSVGARLRCSKKKIHFKMDAHRLLPDYFAVAVDYVAEKMRAERQKGCGTAKFITVFMDYSTPADIPHQIEASRQFCLMKDIQALFNHLNAHGPESVKSSDSTTNSEDQSYSLETNYFETETGAMLKASLDQAKMFFKENPSWMDDYIEQIDAPFWSLRRGKRKNKHRRSSLEQPLMYTTPVQVHSHRSPPSTQASTQAGGHQQAVTQAALSTQVKRKSVQDILPLGNTSLSHLQKCGQFCLMEAGTAVGVFQTRQNSLPSSLASSSLGDAPHSHAPYIPSPSPLTLSKSLDTSLHGRLDASVCLLCHMVHMDGTPGCRRYAKKSHKNSDIDLHHRLSLGSLEKGQPATRGHRGSHTVMQAEVHQEWGGGSHRGQGSQGSPPRELEEGLGGRNKPPGSLGQPTQSHARSTSDLSHCTDDTGSMSDSDSLERDLRSIQNISSFHDFVNSSSFVGSYRAHATKRMSFSHPSQVAGEGPRGLVSVHLQTYDTDVTGGSHLQTVHTYVTGGSYNSRGDLSVDTTPHNLDVV